MYIAETLINPLFTNVVFRRDSEGDGSGHYESGGGYVPPPIPSAICAPGRGHLIRDLVGMCHMWEKINNWHWHFLHIFEENIIWTDTEVIFRLLSTWCLSLQETADIHAESKSSFYYIWLKNLENVF